MTRYLKPTAHYPPVQRIKLSWRMAHKKSQFIIVKIHVQNFKVSRIQIRSLLKRNGRNYFLEKLLLFVVKRAVQIHIVYHCLVGYLFEIRANKIPIDKLR